jgi:undecaprenyl-diphosphatase
MPSRRLRSRRPDSAVGKRGLGLRHALALGLLQGPTELLPVSSSGHTALIPWLAGWSHAELDAELRKSFEVALHAGAGAALAIDMRGELIEATRTLNRRRAAVIALSLAPPVLAGYLLERPIERRLGGPCSIAAGLAAGAVAMALADLRPAPGARREQDAGPWDGLTLGLAQAAALIPGVSRNGATLTAARARGFAREDAQTLSWHAALPVIVGAVALKGRRLWRRGVPDGASWGLLAVGAGGAFVSTSASAGLLRRPRWSARPLLPYAVYRGLLAVVVLRRLRGRHSARPTPMGSADAADSSR